MQRLHYFRRSPIPRRIFFSVNSRSLFLSITTRLKYA